MENQIYKKIAEMMRDVPHIGKDRKTQGTQTYKFRGIDDMYNSLHSIFAKHGVFFTSKLLSASREERKSKNGNLLIWAISDIEFTFYAEDGSFVTSVMRGEAMDTSDKASNKASSAALKYAMMQLLMIPTEGDNDPDKNNHEANPKDLLQEIAEGLLLVNDLDELKKYYKSLDAKTQANKSVIELINNKKEEYDKGK